MSDGREVSRESNHSHGCVAESALLTLTPHEARTAGAVFDRLFPADENCPGLQRLAPSYTWIGPLLVHMQTTLRPTGSASAR